MGAACRAEPLELGCVPGPDAAPAVVERVEPGPRRPQDGGHVSQALVNPADSVGGLAAQFDLRVDPLSWCAEGGHTARDLQARIDAGEYPPDTKIPSYAQLAALYSVGVTTVQRAILILQKASVRLCSSTGEGADGCVSHRLACGAERGLVAQRAGDHGRALDGRQEVEREWPSLLRRHASCAEVGRDGRDPRHEHVARGLSHRCARCRHVEGGGTDRAAEQEPILTELAGDDVEVLRHAAGQVEAGLEDLPDALRGLVPRASDRGLNEFVLAAWEVVVERATRSIRSIQNLGCPRAGGPPLTEEDRRRVHEAFSGRGSLRLLHYADQSTASTVD